MKTQALVMTCGPKEFPILKANSGLLRSSRKWNCTNQTVPLIRRISSKVHPVRFLDVA